MPGKEKKLETVQRGASSGKGDKAEREKKKPTVIGKRVTLLALIFRKRRRPDATKSGKKGHLTQAQKAKKLSASGEKLFYASFWEKKG